MPALSTSNSYVTYAEYATYCDLIGKTPGEQATVEPKLIQSTLALDRMFSSRFLGRKLAAEQPLQWPRIATTERSINLPDGFYSMDADGNYRDFNQVPTEVKQATCELAFSLTDGTDPYVQPQPGVLEETKKVDVIEKSVKYAGSYNVQEQWEYKLAIVLRPVLLPTATRIRFVV